MRKAKMTLTFELDYEINPENYPEGSSYDEMLALGVQAVDEDILSWKRAGEL